MSCGPSFSKNISCLEWKDNLQKTYEEMSKSNPSNAQLNLERNIALFSTNKSSLYCIDEYTGNQRIAKKEFCEVSKDLQRKDLIKDKNTNSYIDKFCK